MSSTGELDIEQNISPSIAVNPYYGKTTSTTYRDTYVMLRNVFICFNGNGGDPGPNWDTDGDGYTDWYISGQGYVYDAYGNKMRDPDDLVNTIIFKQVDP